MKFLKPLSAAGFLLLALTSSAQIKLSLNNGFRSDIQKVVKDYPHQFASLRGIAVEKNPQTTEYASLVMPDGSQESTVIKYSSEDKAIYSWQTVLLRTEDFDEAQKKYKWLFHQIKGLNVTYVVDQYTLRGVYEVPDESRKFRPNGHL